MEYSKICDSDYKKVFKSSHYKSVKHQEKLNQYYCKICTLYMPLSDKSSHLNSDNHKQRIKEQHVWWKIVVKIYLTKQDISEVKFVYKNVNKTVQLCCFPVQLCYPPVQQICCSPVME